MLLLRRNCRIFLMTIFSVVLSLLGIFLASVDVVRAVDEAGLISAYGCKGAGGFVPLECFQGSTKLVDAYNTETLAPFLNKVFVGAISLGAILAVLRLAWAGFQYMASDLWSSKEHAKEIIQDTLLGLFLLIAIYLILKQINPQILDLNVTVGSPTSNSSAPSSNPFLANQPTDI